jgi:phosphohistidine swiveling domain-containing protein
MTTIDARLRGRSDPSRLWTCGGIASELLSDVASPMCWSVWERVIELAYRTVMADYGILRRDEVVFPDDPDHQCVAIFHGRLAANVDATRDLMGRIPGVSANQFEKDMLGGVREGIAEPPSPLRRVPGIVLASTRVMRRAIGEIEDVHVETQAWWQREVLEPTLSGDRLAAPLQRFEAARKRFAETLTAHIRVRLMLQSARGAFVKLAVRAGDPQLIGAVMGGYGGTADLATADDLWLLAHGEIEIVHFLRHHGFRGPHEANLLTRSWREHPERIESMAATLARRRDAPRPRASERRAVEGRHEAEGKLVRDVPSHLRPAMRWILTKLERIVRANQLGRSTYLRTIDGCRAALRDLGGELTDARVLDEPDDVFYLDVSELFALAGPGLPEAHRHIAQRRATRAQQLAFRLPATFTGMPAAETHATATEPGDGPTVLSAAGGSTGVVEGRARIVLDAHAELDLEADDVLVCRATDPSWTSLMTLAAALVIDNGGATSHGAIVAREIGIPCVIGLGDATSRLCEGDRIRVDGDNGTVTVLQRANQAATVEHAP